MNVSIWHWLIVGLVGWVGWRLLTRGRPTDTGGTARALAGTRTTLEVVGESFYRVNLQQLFPMRGEDDDDAEEEREALAVLRMEDDNPYDELAVGVFIDNLKVGNLARGVARAYRQARGADRSDVQADAVVWVPAAPGDHYSVTLYGR